jgi:hypothetical protein
VLREVRDQHAEEEEPVEGSACASDEGVGHTDTLNTKLPIFGDASSSHRPSRAAMVVVLVNSLLSRELDSIVCNMMLMW